MRRKLLIILFLLCNIFYFFPKGQTVRAGTTVSLIYPPELKVRFNKMKQWLQPFSAHFSNQKGLFYRVSAVTINEDTMEVIHQVKSSGEWINNQRTLITAGTDFQSVENFIDHLLNVDDMPQDLFFNFLDQPFKAGFYILMQQWTGSEWENQYRITTTANTNGKMESLTLQEWYVDWLNIAVFQSTYDAQSRMEQIVLQINDGQGNMYNVMRITRNYNNEGNYIKDLIDFYSEGDEQWYNVLRVNYTYDDYGNIIEQESEIYAQITWLDYRRIQKTYDNFQNLVQRLTQMAEQSGMQTTWENELNELFTYDSNDNLTEHLFQIYEQSWEDSLRRSYEYNAQDLQTVVLIENKENADWEYVSKTSTEYQNGNAVEEVYQTWQDEWVNEERITTSYDQQSRPEVMMLFDWMGSAWEESEQYLFDHDYQTSIDDEKQILPANFHVSNFPNPFNLSTTVTVELPYKDTITLRVYDVRGRIVKTLISDKTMSAGTYTATWNGRNESGQIMSSGVYLIQLKGQQVKKVRRCLLVK
ncbi:MAG: FlgD immunoglobulin-like domain containing protein [bacterium]